jgi:hypothetical protein
MRRVHGDLIVVSDQVPSELARVWSSAISRAHDMLARALHVVAGGEPQGAQLLAAWHAKSDSERERWLEQRTSANREPAVDHAARWLREQRRSHSRDAASVETLSGIAGWLPAAEWPALCVNVHESGSLERLAAICMRLPDLPLLALVPGALWNESLSRAEGRTRALLAEGQIVLARRTSALPHAPIKRLPPRSPSSSPPTEDKTVCALRSAAEEARSHAHCAQKERADDADDASERARSLTELLLYELLQREPDTHDLFELNGLMPFAFGSRPAEIDLVSAALKLAIEVDGYHHFTNVPAYRRDRRKDVLLQTHGFWVLRFLADDVIDEGPSIVARIRDIVQLRRQTQC